MEDTNIVLDKKIIHHGTPPKVSKITSTLSHLKKYKMLYIIAIPGILYFLIFKYIPLVGSIIAFKDYNIFKGVFDSPWAGLKHFRTLFENPESMRILKNTLL